MADKLRDMADHEMLPTQNHPSLLKADWVLDIDSKVPDLSSLANEEETLWKKQCIYRIPKGYGNPELAKLYMPQLVSLGPYHHGEEQLIPMEEHKQRAVLHFLARTKRSVSDYTDSLSRVVKQLMDSYDKLDECWKQHPEKFLKLMIFDGCFMLEIFLRMTEKDHPIFKRIPQAREYSKNDPIFSRHGMVCNVPRIQRDMLMIENQIPLLVLKTLLSTAGIALEDDRLINNLVLKFFDAIPKSGSIKTTTPSEDLHVLDMVRKSMLIQDPCSTEADREPPPAGGMTDMIWPATELVDAGILLMKSNTGLNDIKFEKDGILYLPEIVVDDAIESKFLNIVAFEEFHAGIGNGVTAYLYFMAGIIDSEKDVSLLSRKQIITNLIGTDDSVVQLFKRIGYDVWNFPDVKLGEVHRQVIAYCKRKWNRNIAELRHNYFESPWTLISFLAAIFVLSLTIIQVVYSLLDHYQNKKNG